MSLIILRILKMPLIWLVKNVFYPKKWVEPIGAFYERRIPSNCLYSQTTLNKVIAKHLKICAK